MKKYLPFFALAFVFVTSCAHNHYTSSAFEQQSASHRSIAILPAEMIFTGTKPKNLTEEDIRKIEETESNIFQNALFNGILKYANTKRYTTYVSVQDIGTTRKLLEENNISIRSSWNEDDKKLAELLGVDAVVRMRVQKKRYMSDLASLGISIGRDVLQTVSSGKFPVPYVPNKTNDIYASCNIISNNMTLWNDHYERSANYNRPSEDVIIDIADNFGKNFPYRKRR